MLDAASALALLALAASASGSARALRFASAAAAAAAASARRASASAASAAALSLLAASLAALEAAALAPPAPPAPSRARRPRPRRPAASPPPPALLGLPLLHHPGRPLLQQQLPVGLPRRGPATRAAEAAARSAFSCARDASLLFAASSAFRSQLASSLRCRASLEPPPLAKAVVLAPGQRGGVAGGLARGRLGPGRGGLLFLDGGQESPSLPAPPRPRRQPCRRRPPWRPRGRSEAASVSLRLRSAARSQLERLLWRARASREAASSSAAAFSLRRRSSASAACCFRAGRLRFCALSPRSCAGSL